MNTVTSTNTDAQAFTKKPRTYREKHRLMRERRDVRLLAFLIGKPRGVIMDELLEFMKLSRSCIYESLARLRMEGIVIRTHYRRPGRKSFQPIYLTKKNLARLYRIAAAQEAAEAAAERERIAAQQASGSDSGQEFQHA